MYIYTFSFSFVFPYLQLVCQLKAVLSVPISVIKNFLVLFVFLYVQLLSILSVSIMVYKCFTLSTTQIKKGVPYALIKEYIKYACRVFIGLAWYRLSDNKQRVSKCLDTNSYRRGIIL